MDDNRHQLLAQIGSMYYELEKSQIEIAYELGLSRIILLVELTTPIQSLRVMSRQI
jgi:DNA-binding transcriptional regulator LsrR (DeoR family)